MVTFAASFEAIDALPGAKRRSPRIMPDKTKFTDCASPALGQTQDLPSGKALFSPFGPCAFRMH